MRFKDHFSVQAAEYAQFRPQYPLPLFQYLASVAKQRDLAWDCATGNGQVAVGLAEHFRQVVATDASSSQIANAFANDRIRYETCPAERTTLLDASVDLVTVGQALHWFDHPKFFEEVRRVLRPHGVLAVWSYNLFRLPDAGSELNAAFQKLYAYVEPYWPPERQFVSEEYRTISFPFEQRDTPAFEMVCHWTFAQVAGYLLTWSAVQRLMQSEGEQQLNELLAAVQHAWGPPDSSQRIDWPLTLIVCSNC